MKELPNSYCEVVDIALRLQTLEQKERHIKDVIIPSMNRRKNRTIPLSRNEVIKKIYNPPNSSKPGEEFELFREVHRKSTEEWLNVDIALEIADNVYYALQPNAPRTEISNLEKYLAWILGDMPTAFDFAIIKYESRLRYGDKPDHTKIERDIMQEFFKMKNLPDSLTVKD